MRAHAPPYHVYTRTAHLRDSRGPLSAHLRSPEPRSTALKWNDMCARVASIKSRESTRRDRARVISFNSVAGLLTSSQFHALVVSVCTVDDSELCRIPTVYIYKQSTTLVRLPDLAPGSPTLVTSHTHQLNPFRSQRIAAHLTSSDEDTRPAIQVH